MPDSVAVVGAPDRAQHTIAAAEAAPQQFRIIGVLNKLYVLMENADGLVLVDQHVAHERIPFEELRRRLEEKGVPSQRLLLPQTLHVPRPNQDWMQRKLRSRA